MASRYLLICSWMEATSLKRGDVVMEQKAAGKVVQNSREPLARKEARAKGSPKSFLIAVEY